MAATLSGGAGWRRGGELLWEARGAILLAAGLLVYGRLADSFGLFIVSSALVLSLLALGVDLQWGYTGILNLGPAAYLGLGAYVYALVRRNVSVGSPTYLAFALALLLGIALAVVVAYPAFKTRTLPVYCALIRLAVSLILQRWTSVSYTSPAARMGSSPSRSPFLPARHRARSDESRPVLSAGVWGRHRGLPGCLWLTRSRFGRVLVAIREDEDKVATLGYDVGATKLVVAAIAGALGTLAGALYAPLVGTAHPSLFGIALSIQAYVWVAVGGQGTLLGPILAGIALKLLENRLRGVSADGYVMILAAVFMLVVIFLPRGIAGLFAGDWTVPRDIAARLRGAPAHPAPLPEEEPHG